MKESIIARSDENDPIFGFEVMHCVIPENIHTSPTEGIFSKTPPPLWKFQLSFIHFFKFSGLTEPPTPQEIPIPSVGGVWIFSGTAHSCTAFTAVFKNRLKFSVGFDFYLLVYIYHTVSNHTMWVKMLLLNWLTLQYCSPAEKR